jgi:hypothetical protein
MAYTDWIDIVEKTIQNKDRINFLEFGLGEGTEYLVDKFKFVYSHELIDEKDPTLIEWYNKSSEKLKDKKNWKSEVVFWKDINFIDYDPNLPKQLLDRIDELFSEYRFDGVLVDGGYHVRGDIANYVLNKFKPKYVAIHDTNYNYEVDGYLRIILPDIYETVEYKVGEGTHIFVKKG